MLPTFADFLGVVASFLYVKEWAAFRQVSRSVYFGLMSKEEAQQFYSTMTCEPGCLSLTCGKITMTFIVNDPPYDDLVEFKVLTHSYIMTKYPQYASWVLGHNNSLRMQWGHFVELSQREDTTVSCIKMKANSITQRSWSQYDDWSCDDDETVIKFGFLRQSEVKRARRKPRREPENMIEIDPKARGRLQIDRQIRTRIRSNVARQA